MRTSTAWMEDAVESTWRSASRRESRWEAAAPQGSRVRTSESLRRSDAQDGLSDEVQDGFVMARASCSTRADVFVMCGRANPWTPERPRSGRGPGIESTGTLRPDGGGQWPAPPLETTGRRPASWRLLCLEEGRSCPWPGQPRWSGGACPLCTRFAWRSSANGQSCQRDAATGVRACCDPGQARAALMRFASMQPGLPP
jgi:hypothetical protein